jgi:hypothetical protein
MNTIGKTRLELQGRRDKAGLGLGFTVLAAALLFTTRRSLVFFLLGQEGYTPPHISG